MPEPQLKGRQSDRVAELTQFLRFVDEARSFLNQHPASKRHPDVQRIRGEVEEKYQDDRGQPAVYQKFESALYEDAPALVTLWDFFRKFEHRELPRYHKLVELERSALTGDHHPAAILSRSILGMAALLLSGVTVWWGVIKMVSGDDPGSLFSELFHDVISRAMINRVVGCVWLVGMFVVIWYVLRMARNRKQVAFLSTLSRALELYLHEPDDPGQN